MKQFSFDVGLVRSCSRVVSNGTFERAKAAVVHAGNPDELGYYALVLAARAVVSVCRRVLHAMTGARAKGGQTVHVKEVSKIKQDGSNVQFDFDSEGKFSSSDANMLERIEKLGAGSNAVLRRLQNVRNAKKTRTIGKGKKKKVVEIRWSYDWYCATLRALSGSGSRYGLANDSVDLISTAAVAILEVLQRVQGMDALRVWRDVLVYELEVGSGSWYPQDLRAELLRDFDSGNYDYVLWGCLGVMSDSLFELPYIVRRLSSHVVYTVDSVPVLRDNWVQGIVEVYRSIRRAITAERSTRVGGGFCYVSLDSVVVSDDSDLDGQPIVDDVLFRSGRYADVGGVVSSSFQGPDYSGVYSAGVDSVKRVEGIIQRMKLTETQKEVLRLRRQGMSYAQIGNKRKTSHVAALKTGRQLEKKCYELGICTQSQNAIVAISDAKKAEKNAKNLADELKQYQLDVCSDSLRLVGCHLDENKHYTLQGLQDCTMRAIRQQGVKNRDGRQYAKRLVLREAVERIPAEWRLEMSQSGRKWSLGELRYVSAYAVKMAEIESRNVDSAALVDAQIASRNAALLAEYRRVYGDDVVLVAPDVAIDTRYTIGITEAEAQQREREREQERERKRKEEAREVEMSMGENALYWEFDKVYYDYLQGYITPWFALSDDEKKRFNKELYRRY